MLKIVYNLKRLVCKILDGDKMLKNKIIKIVILLFSILVIFNNCKVYADPMDIINGSYTESFDAGLANPLENPNSWKPDTPNDDTEFVNRASTILSIINIIGVVCSVVCLVIIGIKYLLGSVEEKADYKKAMVPYIIGIVLLATCTTVPNILYKVATTAFL